MDIPASIATCAVTGNILKVVLDSRDAGSAPDAVQGEALTVTLTATVPYLSPDEGMFLMPPFRLVTNQVGEIINPGNPDESVLLPATDQTHTPEFRYMVEVASPDLAEPIRWRAAAPADGVLDLSKVVDPPAPEEIPEWEQTLSEVRAARAAVEARASEVQLLHDEAEAFRDDAELFRDQAQQAAAGNLIDDTTPGTLTAYSSSKTESLLAGKAAASHTHSATQITTGTISYLRLPSATTTVRGAVELATDAETMTGTDSVRGVTPSGAAALVKQRAVVVDPADYGVNVAGVDASTEFQALVNSLPTGSEIRCRPGQTIKLSSTVELPKPVTISNGAFIPVAGGETFRITSGRVRILDNVFTGTVAASSVTGEYFVTTDATSPGAYERVEISRNTFTGSNHTPIWVGGLDHFVIDDNRIDGADYAGIMIISGRYGKVRGNNIRDIKQRGDLVNSYGIAITDTANTEAARSRHILVDGNHIEDVPLWTGLDTHSGFDIKFTNNTILGCRNAVAVTAGNATRTTAPEMCLVAGNYMEKGSAPIEVAAIVYTGKSGGGLPDRIATGMIGANTIVGYQQDISYSLVDNTRFVIEPQVFDGPWAGRLSPTQQPWRVYTANVTVPISNSASGVVEHTFPEGFFAPGVNPTVQVTKTTASNATVVVYELGPTPSKVSVGAYNVGGASLNANIVVRLLAVQVGPSSAGVPKV